MTKLYKMTSHPLSEQQNKDATQNLGVKEFLTLPDSLQKEFSQVPPNGNLDETFLLDLQTELQQLSKGDYVLVQGEFGVTYHVVSFCLENGLNPVYATTKRDSTEVVQPDGSTKKIMTFNHVQFRAYK